MTARASQTSDMDYTSWMMRAKRGKREQPCLIMRTENRQWPYPLMLNAPTILGALWSHNFSFSETVIWLAVMVDDKQGKPWGIIQINVAENGRTRWQDGQQWQFLFLDIFVFSVRTLCRHIALRLAQIQDNMRSGNPDKRRSNHDLFVCDLELLSGRALKDPAVYISAETRVALLQKSLK